jgi:hypothetical protein
MSEKSSPDEAVIWQRRLACHANNRAWTLSESLSRTPDVDEEMLQAAQAAMYFWQYLSSRPCLMQSERSCAQPCEWCQRRRRVRVRPNPSLQAAG